MNQFQIRTITKASTLVTSGRGAQTCPKIEIKIVHCCRTTEKPHVETQR